MRKTFLLLISLCLTTVMSFAADRSWDLANWSSETLTNVRADASWVDAGSDVNWTYKPKITTAAELKANSVTIIELKGLNLSSSSESRFMIDTRSGGSFRLTNSNAYLHVPDCKEGDIITIVTKTTKTGEARGFSDVTNATIMDGYQMTSAEELIGKYIVTADGQVRFNPSGGLQIYSVHVQEYVASEPTLSLKSGANEQTVYPNQAIIDIVYEWGGTSTSATIEWDTTIPAGISVNTNNESKTVTISGAPTLASAATYEYSITSTDGTGTSDPLTGSITVNEIPANKKLIAYVTGGTDTDLQTGETSIISKLEESYIVDVLSSTATIDYTPYEAVVLAALPGSGDAGLTALKTIDKPFVNLKPYMYQTSRWNWGTPNNAEKSESGVYNTIVVKDATHDIFKGITVAAETELIMATDSKHNNKRILTPVSAWGENNATNVKTLASIKGSTYDGNVIIGELTKGSVMVDGSGGNTTISQYNIFIGVSEQANQYLTADYLTIVQNAVGYVIDGPSGSSVGICDNTNNIEKTIVAKEYYDLMGKKLSSKEAAPANSIVIERSVYEDGSVQYQKVRYAK